MKAKWAQRQNQRGDTIVEVLIAVAVISSVLAGAFFVSQQSTQGIRNSQEHSEVLQILQGQVEYVRSMALKENSDTSGVFDPAHAVFCIDTSNPAVPAIVDIPFGGGVIPSVASDNLTIYPSACRIGTNGRYKVAIEYFQVDNLPLNQRKGVFHFTGRWDRLGGGQNNNIDLRYRIYPGAAP